MTQKYYKRLSFEQVGDDDSDFMVRLRKGISREATTPKYSVIVSTEGTEVYKRVDRPDLSGSISNRNEITAMIRDLYQQVTVVKADLSYADTLEYLTTSVYTMLTDENATSIIRTYQ